MYELSHTVKIFKIKGLSENKEKQGYQNDALMVHKTVPFGQLKVKRHQFPPSKRSKMLHFALKGPHNSAFGHLDSA